MKKMVIAAALAVVMLIGYKLGIQTATTSEGWIEDDKFVLEVNGQIYEWWIDEE